MNIKNATITIAHKIICQQLNLELRPGEMWGILGPNGSGKTTLLHTLAGLHAITSGDIWLGPDKLTTLSPKKIAKQLAILFQDTHPIFPQTVWDYCLDARYPHLSYFKKMSEQDQAIVEHALQIMELLPFKQQLITRLSGGEKRRLAIAALLAQTPRIYLLDEPTNHLDIRHQLSTLRHFRDLAEKKSAIVMMTLHDMNLAQQFCNRVLLLFPDRSTIQGNTSDILTTENLTRLYQCSVRKRINYAY